MDAPRTPVQWSEMTCETKLSWCAHYYKEYFPYEALERFLCERIELPDEQFCNQIFALFGLSGRVIERHARFDTLSTWSNALVAGQVARMEIGPICRDANVKALDRAALAFDLDVEDYADVMPCETLPDKSTGLDQLSWTHLLLSVSLLDVFLQEVVFSEVESYRSLAVFSGRRGIHLWLPDHYRDWRNTDSMVVLLRSLRKLSEESDVVAHVVAMLRACENGRLFLQNARSYVREAARPDSPLWKRRGKIDVLLRLAEASETSDDAADMFAVMLLAPRVDQQVSRSYKHLLKAPFSIHPGSGLLSLPVQLHTTTMPALASVQLPVKDVEKCSEPFRNALLTLHVFLDKLEE